MLGIHVSEGTAEGWFGQGKPSAILSIIVFVVLISGIAFGIFFAVNAGGETSVSPPNVPAGPAAPTPAAPTPIQTPTQTPTPTPTTPTPTPTQDGKKIILQQYGNAPAVTVGTQEIIAKALAGQYQKGVRVEAVSAICEGQDAYIEGDNAGIFFYFGPAYQGFYIGMWLLEDISGFGTLRKGDTAVFDGEYYTIARNVQNQKLNIVFLDDTRLFLIKR